MYSKPTKQRLNKRLGFFLFLILACLLVTGCTEDKPEAEKEEAVAVPAVDKNKAAIQAVIEKEFTGPNEEYLSVQEDFVNKSSELQGKEGVTYTADPMIGTPELAAYEEFLKETYEEYFMDYAYEHFARVFAFSYQFTFDVEDNDNYKMTVSDIEITQSDNPNAPKNYDFTAQVKYTNKAGETSQHEVSGKAICSEEGKIGKIDYYSAGLMEVIRGNDQ